MNTLLLQLGQTGCLHLYLIVFATGIYDRYYQTSFQSQGMLYRVSSCLLMFFVIKACNMNMQSTVDFPFWNPY